MLNTYQITFTHEHGEMVRQWKSKDKPTAEAEATRYHEGQTGQRLTVKEIRCLQVGSGKR